MERTGLPQMLCLGVNYRTASVALRERFAVSKSRLAEANQELLSLDAVEECVLLSTCNRTELYFWSYAPERACSALLQHFAGTEQLPEGCFYRYESLAALFHLSRVASGLDSMVVGETEIFGQLKDAYRHALEAHTSFGCANRVFQRVFSIAKKVRSETKITSGPTSVGAAAVQMAQQILGELSGRNVLVVGAGDVARSTAQSLKSRGAESIFVANRSYERAVELAGKVGGQVIRFADWIPYLEHIDIVIVSTASPVYVVSPFVLEKAFAGRAQRPLFLIDLSVPRNVDPACASVQGVHVYDMDAMEAATEETRRYRRREIQAGEALIRQALEEWQSELLGADAVEKLSDVSLCFS